MRSGRTVWEEHGRLQGALDIPLSAEGLAEVQERAAELRASPIRAIHSGSDLAARQTAEAVGKVCKRRSKVEAGLVELGLGLWQGLTETEALARNPAAYRLWRKDPRAACPPMGEPVEECHRRVFETLKRLADGNEAAPVLVVCSRLAAAVAACAAKDVPLSRFWEYVMAPATIEKLRLK